MARRGKRNPMRTTAVPKTSARSLPQCETISLFATFHSEGVVLCIVPLHSGLRATGAKFPGLKSRDPIAAAVRRPPCLKPSRPARHSAHEVLSGMSAKQLQENFCASAKGPHTLPNGTRLGHTPNRSMPKKQTARHFIHSKSGSSRRPACTVAITPASFSRSSTHFPLFVTFRHVWTCCYSP